MASTAKARNLDFIKKAKDETKKTDDGKQIIDIELSEAVQPIVKNVTILELIRDCQNSRNHLIQSEEIMDGAWSTLTADEKKDWQVEYNKAKGV